MFSIEYELEDGGWAYAKISNGEKNITIRITYLRDTLKNLAQAALQLTEGAETAKVMFMDEPGEHQILFLKKENENINYRLLWFEDWESWDMSPSDSYKLVLEGQSTISCIKPR
jgi:hypothetical protein